MDGLSAVAGVATAGVQLSKSLYDLYSAARTSRREIEDVANNVSLLSVVLEELNAVLCEDGSTFRPQLRRSAHAIVLRCASIFEDIRRHTGTGPDLKGKKIYDKIAWYFKKERVKPLRSSLESLKSTLNILLHIVQLAKSTKGVEEYPGVKPIGNWYIRQKRRGLACLVIDNRHAIGRLKHLESMLEDPEILSAMDLSEDEQPLTWAELLPTSSPNHKRGQSPERKFVIAFRNNTPQQSHYPQSSQEQESNRAQLSPSIPDSENLLRLFSPQDSQSYLGFTMDSDVESIGRSSSSQWGHKSTARGRPGRELATSRLILDVIPHEAADEAFQSARNMSRFALLEAKAEETIDMLMRRWTYVDAKCFSEHDGLSISSTEDPVPSFWGNTSQNTGIKESVGSDNKSSTLNHSSRTRKSDPFKENQLKTELENSPHEDVEDDPRTPLVPPIEREQNGKKRPAPLQLDPEPLENGPGLKANDEAQRMGDRGPQSSKEPSTPAPPYPSTPSGQCLSCNRPSLCPSTPRTDPHQQARAEAREPERSKEASSFIDDAFGLFENRIIGMFKNPPFQRDPHADLRQETEQRLPHQHPIVENQDTEPVILRDCLGRKFMFPIQTCRSWQNMENLIRRSFSHVESLSPKVFRGSYDILSPTGEIILPEIWDAVIKPGWVVELRLWDSERAEESERKDVIVGVTDIGPALHSSSTAPRGSQLERTSGEQLPTMRRRSLGTWLGSRKSTRGTVLG